MTIYTEALNPTQFSYQIITGLQHRTKSNLYHDNPKSGKDVATLYAPSKKKVKKHVPCFHQRKLKQKIMCVQRGKLQSPGKIT